MTVTQAVHALENIFRAYMPSYKGSADLFLVKPGKTLEDALAGLLSRGIITEQSRLRLLSVCNFGDMTMRQFYDTENGSEKVLWLINELRKISEEITSCENE